jgi:alanine racemase
LSEPALDATLGSVPEKCITETNAETDPQAWMEVDLRQLRANWDAIMNAKPAALEIISVVKDDAYGHGAIPVAKVALAAGARMLAVAAVPEAIELRDAGIESEILVLGERTAPELELCIRKKITPCVGSHAGLLQAIEIARRDGAPITVHLKIDTGMSRYGFRWSDAGKLIDALKHAPELIIEGAMTHFAMSDEVDKTFAHLQLARFNEVISALKAAGISPRIRHTCNSGGFLNLPEAHFERVRTGILPLGVFPSRAVRRIGGIRPIMSVKARLAAVKELLPGDHVGYGMRFTAEKPMRSGVIPVGYGFGYPRIRNQGHVLIHGKKARIIGGVSMDAIAVDLTDIPEAVQWDEATLLGRAGAEEVTVNDIAALGNTVSYDIMVRWSSRLPRRYVT